MDRVEKVLSLLLSIGAFITAVLVRVSGLLKGPILGCLSLVLNLIRPITILIRTLLLFITVPLSFTLGVIRALYPAYLFLGTAAIIGILVGIGLGITSHGVYALLPHDYERESFETIKVARKAPTTRQVMSSRPLKTPTIIEESDEEGKDYLSHKSFGELRRRRG